MQILVVVANIQMRTLKTEVRKGFMRTAIGHELLDPKVNGSSVYESISSLYRKGMRLIFLKLDADNMW